MLVIDTNILIELEHGNKKVFSYIQGLLEKNPSRPVITSLTYSEFLYGTVKESPKKEEKAKEFLEIYDILHTTKNSSALVAEIKNELEKKGKAIPIFDILIASIVMDRNATLLTMDSHFKNIPGLQIVIIEN